MKTFQGIREELGFNPVPLEQAIGRTIAWESVNPPAKVESEQFDYYAAEDEAVAAYQERHNRKG